MDISFFINIFSSSSADFYLALDAIHDSMQEINHGFISFFHFLTPSFIFLILFFFFFFFLFQEKNVNYEIIGLLPERSILQRSAKKERKKKKKKKEKGGLLLVNNKKPQLLIQNYFLSPK